jgi:hypothetical protein
MQVLSEFLFVFPLHNVRNITLAGRVQVICQMKPVGNGHPQLDLDFIRRAWPTSV